VLLLEAMKQTGMAAIGKFVLWGKENLCLIRPLGDTLAMETLFYAEDVRPSAEIEEAVRETNVQDAELGLAEQLITGLVGEWVPEDFANEYRGELRAMLEAKLAGHEITAPEPAPEAPVVDLLEALKRSVAEAKDKKTEKARKGKAAAKAPARSRARAKAS
jgi:DNA end-binding protein Ku